MIFIPITCVMLVKIRYIPSKMATTLGIFSHFEHMEKNIHFDLELVDDKVLITHKHDQINSSFYLLIAIV